MKSMFCVHYFRQTCDKAADRYNDLCVLTTGVYEVHVLCALRQTGMGKAAARYNDQCVC